MEVIEALRMRRSTKSFSTRKVSRPDLEGLVDVARYSPSGNNKNPWRFIAVTKRETLERLSQTHPHCRWLASSQAGIAIVVDPASTRYWLEDCCLAVYSIWLAATSQGIGIAWGAMYQSDDPAESERRQKFVRETLSIPDRYSVPMVLAVGYSDGVPAEKKRPVLDEVICWERYTEKKLD